MSEWISVKDRFPDEDTGEYLCFHKDWGVEVVTLYQVNKFDVIGLGNDKPTHWMSLPKPPTSD